MGAGGHGHQKRVSRRHRARAVRGLERHGRRLQRQRLPQHLAQHQGGRGCGHRHAAAPGKATRLCAAQGQRGPGSTRPGSSGSAGTPAPAAPASRGTSPAGCTGWRSHAGPNPMGCLRARGRPLTGALPGPQGRRRLRCALHAAGPLGGTPARCRRGAVEPADHRARSPQDWP